MGTERVERVIGERNESLAAERRGTENFGRTLQGKEFSVSRQRMYQNNAQKIK